MKLKNCKIRLIDGLHEDHTHCCDDAQYYNGYVSKPLFSAKYCQTCNTLTLNERPWINTIWLLFLRPFWLKEKEFVFRGGGFF